MAIPFFFKQELELVEDDVAEAIENLNNSEEHRRSQTWFLSWERLHPHVVQRIAIVMLFTDNVLNVCLLIITYDVVEM